MKKVGIFIDEIKDNDIKPSEMFSKLGFNTGNMLFWNSLKANIDLDVKSRWYFENLDKLDLDEYKAFVTTDLIWIRQTDDYSYLNRVLDSIGDIALVPISIGLQYNDCDMNYKLNPNTVKLLKRISERCVMGVRGYYTAEILSKHGISNFEVIGCPSVYMAGVEYQSLCNLSDKLEHVTVNFETFFGKLNTYKQDFLTYCADNCFSFVEQAQRELSSENISDSKTLSKLRDWINARGNCFFDINEWREYMKSYDFSMGLRFHGNVAAIWEGVPALFVSCDSRTKELCNFFSLPCIDIEKFDKSKPIEYYYQAADYHTFYNGFAEKKNKWKDFLKKNDLI